MKEDIPQHKVQDVAIAILPKSENDDLWECYIINLKEEKLIGVLVNSRGYGEDKGEQVSTSVLRHFFEEIEANTATLIEPIQTKVFTLTNEYWVSFKINDYMYDRKFVFVKGSIDPMNFTMIPILGRKGVMIK